MKHLCIQHLDKDVYKYLNGEDCAFLDKKLLHPEHL